MNVRLAKKTRKPQRGGFTLIELLVVISIIAVLASLILPGVQNARETARRTQCMSNMRNLGVAAQNYATTFNGALPPLAGEKDIFMVSTASTPSPAPWTVHLLPFLDQTGLYDQLTTYSVNYSGTHSTIGIPVYNCPSDLNSNQPGALSFSANAGYMLAATWNAANAETNSHVMGAYPWRYRPATSSTTTTLNVSTQAPEVAKLSASLGVFWRTNTPTQTTTATPNPIATYNQVDGTNLRGSVDKIRDGSSQTIMFSENISNGGWLPSPAQLTIGNLGFGVVVPNTTARAIGMTSGFVGANDFSFLSTSVQEMGSKINSNLTAVSGTAPRPSSFHPQAVNVVFCDGSAKNLSQSIADSVYVRLITPNGNMYGQAILDGSSY